MNDLYRVCIIVPRGYTHAQCFTETAFLLKHSLHSLGVPCDISVNDPARDRINVLLGWHLVPGIDTLASCTFIPYQFEQLSDAAWDGLSPASTAILQRAFDVWDYSEENVAFLAQRGIRARHVPIGYHEALERIPRDRDKDIDVLFSAAPARAANTFLTPLRAIRAYGCGRCSASTASSATSSSAARKSSSMSIFIKQKYSRPCAFRICSITAAALFRKPRSPIPIKEWPFPCSPTRPFPKGAGRYLTKKMTSSGCGRKPTGNSSAAIR